MVESLTLPDPDGAGPLASPVTQYAYDTLGRLVTVTNPDASTRTFGWDTSDNLISETDELLRTWTYSHDAFGRVIETTSPDPDGTGPLGRTIYRTKYDPAGRISEESITAEGISDSAVTGYGWDAMDNLGEERGRGRKGVGSRIPELIPDPVSPPQRRPDQCDHFRRSF